MRESFQLDDFEWSMNAMCFGTAHGPHEVGKGAGVGLNAIVNVSRNFVCDYVIME